MPKKHSVIHAALEHLDTKDAIGTSRFAAKQARREQGEKAWAVVLPARSKTLIEPESSEEDATVLEWDERWSFVASRTNQAWIWIALCRKCSATIKLWT